MSFEHPLRGFCTCRRNQYIIQVPKDAGEVAQVHFNTDPSFRLSQATPITAFIRVPLTWYSSVTVPYFQDETPSMIKRIYENPSERSSRRHFCGFCGTPLSYWSEEPSGEADYIQVTVGSLCRDDLGDLEDMGLIPESPEPERAVPAPAQQQQEMGAEGQKNKENEPAQSTSTALAPAGQGRETLGIPWFDSLLAGSRLGNLRTSRGSRASRDGNVRVEWEIAEWTDEDDAAAASGSATKRKLGDRDDGETEDARK